MVDTVTREEVIDFNDYEEVDEGFPVAAPGPYLATVTNPTAVKAKSGRYYINYTPTLLKSMNEDDATEDSEGTVIKGMMLRFDSLFLTPNPVTREGTVRTKDEIEKLAKRMRGQTKRVIRNMTGEDVALSGTESEVAQQICDAIRGATFVAQVGVRGNGSAKENYIRGHDPVDTWQGEPA